MTANGSTSQYVLGSTDAEQERLIRQAARLDPYTERLFRDAGMGPGQRILDIGSGVGDVAMLAARLVGPSGEIVGVERDVRSIAKARARAAEAGLHNVTFMQSDVTEVTSGEPLRWGSGPVHSVVSPRCRGCFAFPLTAGPTRRRARFSRADVVPFAFAYRPTPAVVGVRFAHSQDLPMFRSKPRHGTRAIPGVRRGWSACAEHVDGNPYGR